MTMNADNTQIDMGSEPAYCSFCRQNDPTSKVIARYDFKTIMGPWAYGCDIHWRLYRPYHTPPPGLGLGIGQKLTYDFDKVSSEERG